jgi:membrane associated rhomboid family serine protease
MMSRKISEIDGRHGQFGRRSRKCQDDPSERSRKREILSGIPRHRAQEAQMIPIRNAVPSRYPPVVTWILIATNCLVFLFQDSLSPDELELFLGQFALIPARYSEAFAGDADLAAVDFVPFFTMMFLHGGWLHLILNMWTLWLFGPAIEDRLGHFRYLAFYLACGLAASAAHVMFNPTSIVPALGASGAIAGILGCYMRLFPLARVVVVIPILFIPLFFEVYAFVFIGLWFLIQVLQSVMALLLPAASGDVAWWAHVGGFIAGFTLGPLLVRSEELYRVYYPDEGQLGFDVRGRI